MKNWRPTILMLVLTALCILQAVTSVSTQTQVIGVGTNIGGSDNQTAGTANAVGIQGFDGTTWDRVRSYTPGFSNVFTDGAVGHIGTVTAPYVYDGANWDALESAFLVQQQGTSPQDSNDGSGIPVGALFGFDRGLQTYNLLSSSSAASLGTSPQIRVNSSTFVTAYQVQATQTTAIDVLNVTAPINPDLYFEGVNVSCLAACVVNIHIATAAGATCTAVAPANLNAGGSASTATSNTNCTTDPTLVANSAIRVDLPATSSRWVDLTGINATIVGDGVSCISSTATTVSCTIRWYEK
jgi:hypothetical protein